MSFKLSLTKAQMLWKMQDWKRPAEVYLSMEGAVSNQYCFMIIRDLYLLGLAERRQGLGRAVVYRATEEGIKQAAAKLKERDH